VETEVETEPEPDAGAETDVHADTGPKPAGNIGSHTKAAAEFVAAPGAESTTVAAEVPRINDENVDTVCAGDRSSVPRKRIYNGTSKIDQVSLWRSSLKARMLTRRSRQRGQKSLGHQRCRDPERKCHQKHT
jgi:U3 small nucleolar ribonucleoprotein component